VRRELADAYVAGLTARAEAITVGDPLDPTVGLGPMINTRQRTRAHELLVEAVAQGARIVTGGSGTAPYFQPTVVVDVTPEMRLWTEEIFAPIAPVLVVDDDAEAVQLANDTSYGLVDSVLTADLTRGLAIARRLSAGMVHINDATPQDEALAPFGGVGQSGLGGRAGGDSNLDEFTERRWLTVAGGPAHYPY
jgi:benzaldehyde dehydrogenase (NAD)